MKETEFIDKNKKKWHEFEKLSKNNSKDPDKLSDLFIELTEDLSYAKTFYPKRSVRVYLNYLAQQIFISFNKTRKKFLFTFVLFWKQNLPLEMYRSRKQLLISFLFFAVAVLIGAVSSYIDPEFLRVVVGDYYVDMTIENINNGDPMAVYKQQSEGDMFLQITINNIRVAIIAFIMGIFFSAGTAFILVSNGFMLGAFQYFFYAKGLFLTSFLTIWIHGTFEISVIIIAGAGGIVMGNGLLFPKTLTRTQSLQIHARRGINILLGTVPIFIIAGFLEGYVTRHTEMPDILKWFIILGSLAFILFYFVFYPLYLGKKLGNESRIEEKPVHVESKPLEKFAIRDFSHLFYDTFRFYKLYVGKFGSVIMVIIFPLTLVYLGYAYSTSYYSDYFFTEGEALEFTFGGSYHFNWINFGVNVLFFSLNIATIIHCLTHINKFTSQGYLIKWMKEIWPYVLKTIPIVSVIFGIIMFFPGWALLLSIFVTPFIVLVFYPAISPDFSFSKGISKGMSYGGKEWGTTFITFLLMTLLAYIFSWSYHNPIFEGLDLKSAMIDEIVDWHTITVFDNYVTIKNFISSAFIVLIIQFLIPLLIIAFGFQFMSVHDKEEALGLRKRFESFGKRNKVFEDANGK